MGEGVSPIPDTRDVGFIQMPRANPHTYLQAGCQGLTSRRKWIGPGSQNYMMRNGSSVGRRVRWEQRRREIHIPVSSLDIFC
jgi:hypothetical protein